MSTKAQQAYLSVCSCYQGEFRLFCWCSLCYPFAKGRLHREKWGRNCVRRPLDWGQPLNCHFRAIRSQQERYGCCSDISMHFPTVILNLFISPFLAICLPQVKIWGKSRIMATAGGEEAAVTASPGAVFELYPKLCVCDGVMLKCLNKIARNL